VGTAAPGRPARPSPATMTANLNDNVNDATPGELALALTAGGGRPYVNQLLIGPHCPRPTTSV
ncbi:MAG: hypothetical protein WBQ13_05220, partial [Terriglobales bacterium]